MAKDKNKKPFNVLSKKGFATLALAGVMAVSPFMLVGCGEPGPKGDTGATGATGSNGKSAYELAVDNGFTGTLQEWLDSLKGQNGGSGSAGKGIQSITKTGTNGLVDTYTITFTDGTTETFEITNGEDGVGTPGASSYTHIKYANVMPDSNDDMTDTASDYLGIYVGTSVTAPIDYTAYTWYKIKGEQGDSGKDGTSVYIGYDGYIWNGAERTEFSANANLGENVVENTIGIEGIMSKYFEGSYIDLSSNTVALMANYMASANVTQYSGTKITQLKVVAEEAGNLYIGTAKVADIVNARTNGTTYTSSTTAHEVTAGLNTITLELNVAEDETIVIGGQNSVGLYHTQGITTNDEHGNYTLIDGTTHTEVISETSDIQDTLAIQVSAVAYAETQLFSGASSKFEQTPSAIFNSNYKMNYSPYTYQNANYFAGKHITRIGIPVIGVKAIDANQTLTIYTFDKSLVGQVVKENQTSAKYTVKLPVEELQGATYDGEKGYYVVDKWIYVDVDIQVGANETIAWGEYDPNYDDANTMVTTDTIYWGLTTQNIDTNYIVYGTLGDDAVVSGSSMNMLFDFYESGEISFEEHLEILKKKIN